MLELVHVLNADEAGDGENDGGVETELDFLRDGWVNIPSAVSNGSFVVKDHANLVSEDLNVAWSPVERCNRS